MNYKKLRKNVKAVSPVISVLLMIAVAVAASLVTYAWVMGYMNFTTTKVGKAIAIQSIDVSGKVYVQNVGQSTVTLTGAYLNGLNGTSVGVNKVLSVSDTAVIQLTSVNLSAQTVTVKVTSDDGSFAELTKTFP